MNGNRDLLINRVLSDDRFSAEFAKDPGMPSAQAYEVYIAGARKLWDKYSEAYDLRPRSKANVRNATNRGVEFYKNGVHIIGISIGLYTTTLYVHDEETRAKLKLDYNQDNRGQFRCTMLDVDRVMQAINDVL